MAEKSKGKCKGKATKVGKTNGDKGDFDAERRVLFIDAKGIQKGKRGIHSGANSSDSKVGSSEAEHRFRCEDRTKKSAVGLGNLRIERRTGDSVENRKHHCCCANEGIENENSVRDERMRGGHHQIELSLLEEEHP